MLGVIIASYMSVRQIMRQDDGILPVTQYYCVNV